MARIVLSDFQAAPLLEARRVGARTATTSADLNLTRVEAQLTAEGILFPDGASVGWPVLEEIHAARSSGPFGARCYVVETSPEGSALGGAMGSALGGAMGSALGGAIGGKPRPVQAFSEETQRHYTLAATPAAPTMLISGIPMHRVKGTDPYQDTLLKVRTIAPLTGRVLDTTTGLGYTASEAAKTAAHVTTIELDPAVLEVARQNPWSQAIFTRPNVTQLIGDSFERVRELPDASFSRILHDPPTFGLAGDLYSGAFYRELYRVLQRGGRLFHYTGNLESGAGGRVAKGAGQRLREAGFSNVRSRPEAFGLVAAK